MALDSIKNFAKATLSTGYDSSATSIVVNAGEGAKFPAVPFNAVWWDNTAYSDPADDPNVEIVRVTNIATDTLTVTRAQESTSATNKNTGGHTYKLIEAFTKKTYDEIDTHISASTGVHGVTGSVVGTSDSQSLTNKTLDNTNAITVLDTNLTIQDNLNTTKQAVFQASGISPATTRTLTIPDANTTIVGTDATQTLTSKTIDDDNNTIQNVDFETAIKQSTFYNQNFINFARNGSFESWSSGVSSAPDGWALSGLNATIAKETTTIKTGLASAKLTRVGTDCLLTEDTYASMGSTYVRSRTFTFGAWVWASVASRVRLRISDGVTQTFGSYHTGDSTWQFLTVTATAGAAVTAFNIGLSVDTGNTSGYIDGAILVEGTVVPSFFEGMITDDGKSIIVDSATNNVTISRLKPSLLFPPSDSTTAIQVDKADGTTNIVNIDTTNKRVGFGGNTSPAQAIDVTGSGKFSTSIISPIYSAISDSTTAIKLTKADGSTSVVTVDTTNSRVGIGATPSRTLDINGYMSIGDGSGNINSRIEAADATSNTADARWLFRNGTDTHAALRMIANSASNFSIDAVQANSTSTTKDLLLNVNGGNVGIGCTPAATNTLQVQKTSVGGNARMGLLNPDNTNSASNAQSIISVGGASAGDPSIIFDVAGVTDWFVGIDNSDSDKFKIAGNIGVSDVLVLDTNKNLGIATSSFPSGGGTPALVMAQASGNPTGMGSNTAGIFAKDVGGTCEAFAIDEAGNVTQLSSHPADKMMKSEHIYPIFTTYENEYLGKKVTIDTIKLIEAVEKLTGEKIITVEDIPKKKWDNEKEPPLWMVDRGIIR